MNLNKFTEKAQESVITAQNLATELTHSTACRSSMAATCDSRRV